MQSDGSKLEVVYGMDNLIPFHHHPNRSSSSLVKHALKNSVPYKQIIHWQYSKLILIHLPILPILPILPLFFSFVNRENIRKIKFFFL